MIKTTNNIQRRRRKVQLGIPIEESVHETKGQAKAVEYLQLWESDRSSWKFEKCRQIWLLHNAYEKTRVPDDLFPTLLRYMDSIKGGMRGLALDIAKKKLEKADKEDEDEPVELDEEVIKPLKRKAHVKEVTESEKNRAKKVIKMLTAQS